MSYVCILGWSDVQFGLLQNILFRGVLVYVILR